MFKSMGKKIIKILHIYFIWICGKVFFLALVTILGNFDRGLYEEHLCDIILKFGQAVDVV